MPIDPEWDHDGEVLMIKVCRNDNNVLLSEDNEGLPKDPIIHKADEETILRYVTMRVRTWIKKRWRANERIS